VAFAKAKGFGCGGQMVLRKDTVILDAGEVVNDRPINSDRPSGNNPHDRGS